MRRFGPWEDLPQELLLAIASLLSSNPLDILRLRCVCKSWFSSSLSLPTSTFSPPLPLLVPNPPLSFWSFPVILSTTIVYSIRSPSKLLEVSTSPNTWLLFVNQLNPGKVSIWNPITGQPFSKPLDFPHKLNLLDFGASEICRYYNINQDGHKLFKPNWFEESLKVIFMPSRSVIVALFEGNLGLLKLGIENKAKPEWDIILTNTLLDDIVEYRGRLLGINSLGGLYEMMGDQLSEISVIVPPVTDMGGGGKRKRLIELSGTLCLVIVTSNNAYMESVGLRKITVYRLNEEAMRWIEVTSIGDQILFFGIEFSFSISSQEFEGFCGKNCIIFEQLSFEKFGGYLQQLHESAWRAYHLEDGADVHVIEMYPCYSDILWPPPIWMNTGSKLLGTLEAAINRLFMGSQDENLKAKYKELHSLVRVVVSGGGLGQQDVINSMKEIDILKDFMIGIELEIEKDMKGIRKHIAEDAVIRHTRRDSIQMLNKLGTSRSDQRTRCVDCVRKATKYFNINNNDWVSCEMRHRLGTHVELSAILRGAVHVLEKHGVVKTY